MRCDLLRPLRSCVVNFRVADFCDPRKMNTLDPPVMSLMTATSCAGEGNAAARSENIKTVARKAFLGIDKLLIIFQNCGVPASRSRADARFHEN